MTKLLSTTDTTRTLPTLTMGEKIYQFFSGRQREKWTAVAPQNVYNGCALISVGNITTGGTGKTPAVQWLARKLAAPEHRIAVVARGYRGRASAAGAVVSDGQTVFLSAEQGGDEPVLHGRSLPGVPVLIGRNRNSAVQQAIEHYRANVIVLDDAFQFWSLPRDFDLVLLDARRPFDNTRLLPRGHLRELPSALQRADAILLTRCELATPEQLKRSQQHISAWTDAPIYLSNHDAVAIRDEATGEKRNLDELRGNKVVAISALADNSSFVAALTAFGAKVVASIGKRDHHRWDEREIAQIARQAVEKGAVAIVTTEKDAVKINTDWSPKLPVWSLVIELKVVEDEALLHQIRRCIVAKAPVITP